MTLDELYASLEGLDNGHELIQCVKNELSTLRGEAAKHRTDKVKAETTITELTDQLAALKNKNQTNNDQDAVKVLEARLEQLTSKYEQAEKARQEAENKRIQADINTQLTNSLTKHNAIDPAMVGKLIVDNIKVNDDGTYSYIDGDFTGSIDEGVSKFLEKTTWAVRDSQKAGTGGKPTGSVGSDKPPKKEISLQAALARTIDQE